MSNIPFDPDLYKSLYPDLQNLSDDEAMNHWINHGCKENRIGSDVDKNIFDYEYYFKNNEDVIEHCQNDEIKAKQHWYLHGKNEMRVGFPNQKYLTQIVVVITRTSKRPNQFAICRQSVLEQTYPYIGHFITYDNIEDSHYIKHLPNTMYIEKESDPYKYSFPYNNYINTVLKIIPKPSWVIILDDDDMFTSPHAIEIIMRNISVKYMSTNTPPLFVWSTKIEENTLPNFNLEPVIQKGNIPSCSFMFHSHYGELFSWKPVKGGDYFFTKEIFDKIKDNAESIIRIPAVLTATQYSSGFGMTTELTRYSKNIETTQNILWDSIYLIDKYKEKERKKIDYEKWFELSEIHMCYLLCLERRSDKKNTVIKRIRDIHIPYTIHYGYDGKTNDFQLKFKKYQENNYEKPNIPSSGSYAILHSMKDMINLAKKQNYENILVLQDDVYFCKDFIKKVNIFLECCTSIDWKLLYLGCTQHKWPKYMQLLMINEDIGFYYPQGSADGAFAVLIHSSVYDELLYECDKDRLPFDSGALKTIQKKYPHQCISAWPYLVIADVRDSDCRPPRDQIRFAQKCKWDMNQFNLKD